MESAYTKMKQDYKSKFFTRAAHKGIWLALNPKGVKSTLPEKIMLLIIFFLFSSLQDGKNPHKK